MAKYVFLNMPARGHVNPTLPIAQELVRRGEDVSYYLTEEFREVVEATGAKFQPYESKISNRPMPPNFGTLADKQDAPNGLTIGPSFLQVDVDFVPPQVIDRIGAEKPDVIIYDFMSIWARKIIDELHIPAISTRPTYAYNEHFSIMKQPGNSATNPMNTLFQVLSHAELLNIVFIPREFQPAGETFDERFVFVGPSILPRPEAPNFPFEKLDSERPLLYISLGSVFNNQPEFYQQCFAAFGDQPWQVVLATGKHTNLSKLGATPANFLLWPYVPQLEILPRTKLFITHAGANSVMESLYFGVPMVLFPLQPEQQFNARRVEEMGLGVALSPKNVNATTLREAVDRITSDSSYYERVRQMQQSVHASGGYKRAADAIMEFTAVRAGR